jgi:hypothetical protein
MPRWLKVVLIIAIVVVVLILGVVGTGVVWWMKNKDALMAQDSYDEFARARQVEGRTGNLPVPHGNLPHGMSEARLLTQHRARVRVFAQAESALDENLVHREQHKPLFVGRETLLGTMVGQVASEHPLFRETAAFVFIRAHRLDHSLA